MKTIVLMRHAKSDRKTKKLRDIERPLNKRGLRDAAEMGTYMKSSQVKTQLIISSPAIRALKTAELVAGELNIDYNEIITDPNLYLESKSTIMNCIKKLDDKYESIFIVSHNPGLTDLVNYLTIETIKNIPTSGIVAMRVDVQNWAELDMGNWELIFFESPKKLRTAVENLKEEEIQS